jgi:lipopolysaccharide export system permease protein
MIKKIDKLILTSFIGPFIMTFFVVVFILLTQHMLKYFDDIIGKDLGWSVVGTLLFYFGIFMVPVAMPLAILLSSLITFGNLGEHFELTAVKSLGISMTRSLMPIFCFVVLLTFVAFWANNNLVPKAALEAYSLMYDIKQKKPALDLREGAFYNSIPDISVKVNERLKDQTTLKGVIIYDHRNKTGNKEVIMADSGKMYTILDAHYLKFELFKGYRYTEGSSNEKDISGRPATADNSSKTKFSKMQVVFDLSSFGLNRTEKKWFSGNRIMRNTFELNSDMDSVKREMDAKDLEVFGTRANLFRFFMANDTMNIPKRLRAAEARRDSLSRPKLPPRLPEEKPAVAAAPQAADPKKPLAVTGTPAQKLPGQLKPASVLTRKPSVRQIVSMPTPESPKTFAPVTKKLSKEENERRIAVISDSLLNKETTMTQLEAALSQVRLVKSQFENAKAVSDDHVFRYKEYQIQWHKIFSNSIACIVMFLIGAPLGAIIKKGGLGIPVLTSILFFIFFYLMTMTGEKWSKAGTISVPVGIWFSDIVLFIIGLLFLRQARVDARLFDADFYNVVFDKFRTWVGRRKIVSTSPA